MDTHNPPFWRQHLLAVLGAHSSGENLSFLAAWEVAEGGTAKWNPLNTTFKLPGSTDYNDNNPPVQNYPRPVWGVCALALTLSNGFYGKIVGHLQAGTYTAEEIVNDCWDQIKTWGTNPQAILDALKSL